MEPFPNWEMQKLGDCSAIQFVQSMQVGGYKGDARGYKWVQLDAKSEACRWRRTRRGRRRQEPQVNLVREVKVQGRVSTWWTRYRTPYNSSV